jgi:uncharacterized protein involved in outer membrane biogenesis
MRWGRLLIVFILVLAALFGAAIVALNSIDWSEYQSEIADQVRAATGRELRIDGELGLAVGLQPGVQITEVALSNADWAAAPEMLTLDRFLVRLRLLPLFSGNVEVSRLELSSLDVVLETNAEGKGNWVFSAEPTETAAEDSPAETGDEPGDEDAGEGVALQTHIGRILIEDIRLRYVDGVSGVEQRVTLDRFEASSKQRGAPLEIALQGAYNEHPFEVETTLEGTAGVLGGGPLGLEMAARAGGATVELTGEIDEPLETRGIELAFAVHGEDLAQLSEVSGAEVPDYGAYRIEGKLRDIADGYQIDELMVSLADHEIRGSVSALLAGERPKVVANLHAPKLDADRFTGGGDDDEAPAPDPKPKAEGGDEGEPAPADPNAKVIPNDPLPLDGLRAADAEVSFRADQIVSGGIEVRDFSVDLRLDNGKLAIEPLAARLSGGSVGVKLNLDAGSETPSLSTTITIRGVDVGDLLRSLDLGDGILEGGSLDLDANLAGRGTTPRQIASGLGGRIDLKLQDGTIRNEYAEIVFSDVGSLVRSAGKGEEAKVNCVRARFDVKRGVATGDGIVVDTSALALFGEGGLRLDRETIDLRFTRQAKSANITAALPPIKIDGTFAAPEAGLDADYIGESVRGTIADLLGGGSRGPREVRNVKAGHAGCEQLIAYRDQVQNQDVREKEEARKAAADTSDKGIGGMFNRLRGNLRK